MWARCLHANLTSLGAQCWASFVPVAKAHCELPVRGVSAPNSEEPTS